jgi:TolB-like protein
MRLTPALSQANFQDRLRLSQMTTLAVLPFESLSNADGASDIVTDSFATALYGARRFNIMERAETLRRTSEAGITLPPVVDRSTALKVARALGVDGVFIGTVTEYQYLFYPEDAVVGIKVELLDVETGQVVWTGVFNDRHYGLIQGSDEPITSLAQSGAAQLVNLLSPPVNPQYPYVPVTPDPTQKTESLNAQAAH